MWGSPESGSSPSDAAGVAVIDNDEFLLKLLFLRDRLGVEAADVLASLEPVEACPPVRPEEGIHAAEEISRRWAMMLDWLVGARGRAGATHAVLTAQDRERLPEVLPPPQVLEPMELLDLDAFGRWYAGIPSHATEAVERGDEAAHRASVDAESRGLRVIIVLPVSEPTARTIHEHALLLSWGVYADAARRRDALRAFAKV
jgi:hypothetical protein